MGFNSGFKALNNHKTKNDDDKNCVYSGGVRNYNGVG